MTYLQICSKAELQATAQNAITMQQEVQKGLF